MSPAEITKIPELCQDGGPEWPHPEHYVKYTYKLTTAVFKHDHTTQTFDLSKEKQCEPAADVTGGSYTITEVKPDADDGGNKKKTITVSGAVALPDSEDAEGKDKENGTK